MKLVSITAAFEPAVAQTRGAYKSSTCEADVRDMQMPRRRIEAPVRLTPPLDAAMRQEPCSRKSRYKVFRYSIRSPRSVGERPRPMTPGGSFLTSVSVPSKEWPRLLFASSVVSNVVNPCAQGSDSGASPTSLGSNCRLPTQNSLGRCKFTARSRSLPLNAGDSGRSPSSSSTPGNESFRNGRRCVCAPALKRRDQDMQEDRS